MLDDGQPSRIATVILSVTIALMAVGLLWLQVSWTWPYFSDDSFISLRYADRMLAGRGLTWNDAERVEGYSNLLWVLGCAVLGACSIDLVLAARILGFACTVATLVVLVVACPPRTMWLFPAAAAGPMALAASAPLAVWTCGGLEGPMVLLWVVWGSSALLRLLQEDHVQPRALLRPGLPFALLCLTRPDGPLWGGVTALTVLVVWWRRTDRVTALLRVAYLLLLPAVAVLGQLVFRIAYYGEWVPNTAHVKLMVSPATVAQGWQYLSDGMWVLGGALLLALPGIAMVFRREWRSLAWVLLVPVLAMCGYVVLIGGDHFLGWRHLLAPLAGLVLLGCLGLSMLAQRLHGFAIATAIACVAPMLLYHCGRSDKKTADACTEIWEWEGEILGRHLGQLFGRAEPRLLLAVDGAGAVPFFSGLECLDMMGLNDRQIATHPSREGLPEDFVVPGHSIGNGRLVMDRAPALLLHGSPPGHPLPQFPSGWQLEQDPRFLNGYRCVMLETPEATLRSGGSKRVRAPLWMRLEGECGVQSDERVVNVPAYLLGSYQEPYPLQVHVGRPPTGVEYGKWVADGQVCLKWWQGTPHVAVAFARQDVRATKGDEPVELMLEMRDRTPAVLRGVELPAGLWKIALEPSGGPVEVLLRSPEGTALPNDASGWRWSGGKVDLVAVVKAPAPLPQKLASVRLLRE